MSRGLDRGRLGRGGGGGDVFQKGETGLGEEFLELVLARVAGVDGEQAGSAADLGGVAAAAEEVDFFVAVVVGGFPAVLFGEFRGGG